VAAATPKVHRRGNMRIRFAVAFICVFLPFVSPVAHAQTVNGNIDAAFAVGRWGESHEGVSLFCARVTTRREVIEGDSNGACFLTEAQAYAKDSVVMSTNLFTVQTWDTHTLTAVTEFYLDKDGNQVTQSTAGAMKVALRLVLNFDAHQMTKFVEASNGSTVGYHLVGQ
jgi:hypothetical protein